MQIKCFLQVFNQKGTFQKFLLELTAEQRKEIYEETLAKTEASKRVMVLGNALRLENQIILSRPNSLFSSALHSLWSRQKRRLFIQLWKRVRT